MFSIFHYAKVYGVSRKYVVYGDSAPLPESHSQSKSYIENQSKPLEIRVKIRFWWLFLSIFFRRETIQVVTRILIPIEVYKEWLVPTSAGK